MFTSQRKLWGTRKSWVAQQWKTISWIRIHTSFGIDNLSCFEIDGIAIMKHIMCIMETVALGPYYLRVLTVRSLESATSRKIMMLYHAVVARSKNKEAHTTEGDLILGGTTIIVEWITKAEFDRLDAIGFEWTTPGDSVCWDERHHSLQEFNH